MRMFSDLSVFLLLQILLMTLESSKISALLDMLDFSPGVCQKTLVVANSAEEVEDVYKVKSCWLSAGLVVRVKKTRMFCSSNRWRTFSFK